MYCRGQNTANMTLGPVFSFTTTTVVVMVTGTMVPVLPDEKLRMF
jgi:hypothetical protein